jgi:arylsulfatase A-like enzyme
MRILYLDLDTLRPDHLGCYGYCRDTSPNLDRVAAEGVRFENCYASDAPCLPSRAALWTGMFGIRSGMVNHGGRCADPRPEGASRPFKNSRKQWMDALRAAGYRTASVSPFAERHSAWWFCAGFNQTFNTGKSGGERADEILPPALDWLRRNAAGEDWFLHVNFWDPHTPYRTPAEYGNPFEGSPCDDWLTEELRAGHYASYGPHSAHEPHAFGWENTPDRFPRLPREIASLDDYRRWIDGYDVGIRYADDHVGAILDELARQKLLDDTAVIVSADHGESQGELNVYGDHQFADHSTSRVPLLVRWPGVGPGVDRALHYGLDLAPTVTELAGGKPEPHWDGVSFAEALRAGREEGRDELVVSQCAWSCQRAVRWDRWMMIRTYHDGWKELPERMLFDVENDPHETRDLAPERPDLVNEGLARLEAWRGRTLAASDHPVDPLDVVISEGGPYHANDNREPLLRRYCQRLRETGRADCAERLLARRGRGPARAADQRR